jgi:uncharacterized protein
MSNTSIRGVKQAQERANRKAPGGGVFKTVDKLYEDMRSGRITQDSFQNFLANVGIGTDNLTSGSTYGFNPVTRNRILLEWIHRGSWVGGMAIDVIADDMTRAGVELKGEIEATDIERINEAATTLGLLNSVNDTVRWSRLYGGAVMVPLIDGQDMANPLQTGRIAPNQLKGFLVLDRWMVDPSLEKLVDEYGPDYGMPMFYRITGEAPGLRNKKVHHSRILRLEGDRLPYWQRVIENLWGTSVLERIYDRLVAFDSATQGGSQLVYKAWLRTMKIKGLREIVSAGGQKMVGLTKYVDMMRRFQGIEGITLIDGEDELVINEHGAFAGLAEALGEFGRQLGGALQIPLVRLFGESPGGLNATGESDLKTYYDGILQRQERNLRVPLTRFYRILAASEGIRLPDGFTLGFKPLWQMSDKDKAEIAEITTRTVVSAVESQLLTPAEGAQELKQSSDITGIMTSISDESIQALKDQPPPGAGDMGLPATENAISQLGGGNRQLALHDAAHKASTGMGYFHDLQVVVEHPKGAIRKGIDGNRKPWEVTMPADYGYVRGTLGADLDPIDCYVGPDHASRQVYIVDQLDPYTHRFDEHKCLLGFYTPDSAKEAYLAGHNQGAKTFGSLREMGMDEFKTWLTQPRLVREAV